MPYRPILHLTVNQITTNESRCHERILAQYRERYVKPILREAFGRAKCIRPLS
jgi:hypothetical protein